MPPSTECQHPQFRPPQDPHPLTPSPLSQSFSGSSSVAALKHAKPPRLERRPAPEFSLACSIPWSRALLHHRQTRKKSCQLPAADFVPPHCSARSTWLPSHATLTLPLLRPAAHQPACTQAGPKLAGVLPHPPSLGRGAASRPSSLALAMPPSRVLSVLSCCLPASHEGSSFSNYPAQKQTPPTAVTGAATTPHVFLPFLPPCSEFSWFCNRGSLHTVRLLCPGLEG